jgi:lysophospholipase L1-like esterase
MRKYFRVAAAVALVFGVCLVLGEVALQAHFRWSKGYWLFLGSPESAAFYIKPVDDRRGYSLREYASSGRYSINGKGFRGTVVDPDSPAPLVCVIGDSVPFGTGVSDRGTFPEHLQRLLRAQGSAAQVLNGGVPGYNLRQSFDRWRIDIAPAYRCRLLLVTAANDISLIEHFGPKWTPDLTWAAVRWSIVANRFAISFYALEALRRLQTGSLSEQERQQFIDVVLASIGEAVDEAGAQKIPVVILPVNYCYYVAGRVDDADSLEACGDDYYAKVRLHLQPSTATLNAGLKALAARQGVYYLPVDEFFDRRDRAGMFIDIIHLSGAGNRELAGFISAFLWDEGLLE